MVNYTPPPPTLEHLNPIQRYMQKGQLDNQDYMRLGALVLVYFIVRPYLHKAAKWFFADEKIEAGEKAQEAYMMRRAKVSANAIRSGKSQENAIIEQIEDDNEVATSGSNVDKSGHVVNRKSMAQPAGKKPVEEQLLDWDDEPARAPVKGERTDVMQWLDKWDK